ncbi:sensor histidine kinase [Oryzobacter telluris]|uniref:sensor histidine kinase n=1 Tax=Oryzobacter telluris TaxID=3149179 RepID=UPI00370D59EB
MTPRLGLRSRILALTMPVVVLVSAAIAGIIYTSLGQVFDVSAREIAVAEALELRTDIRLHSIDDLDQTHVDDVSTRVSQVVSRDGRVLVSTDRRADTLPIADPKVTSGGVTSSLVTSLPGLGEGRYAVAAVDAVAPDGSHYTAIVAVPTRVETSALSRSLEFALIGALGLVAVLAAVTTFAVGQALQPVDRMRHQVEDLAASRPAPSLEVPPGRDELSRLAETLNAVLERLRAADAARRAFVADAGHELRSPLATIRILLDRILEERPDRERQVIAGRVSAEVDRLSVLVEDLLALAAADERAFDMTSVDVDLDDVVAEESGALRARGMPIEVRVEPVRVSGDPHRLGRVVRNLLENAERHMEGRIRVSLTRDGGTAHLVVDNDGPPVHEGDRDRIFARFVRLDDSRTRDTGGSGLGLAIVAEIVDQHGGVVVADESPEGWCRFAVSLPLAPRSG